jgi:hypothetical protein
VLKVLLAMGVLQVEIAAAGQDSGGGHLPRPLVLFTVIPPGQAVGRAQQLREMLVEGVVSTRPIL